MQWWRHTSKVHFYQSMTGKQKHAWAGRLPGICDMYMRQEREDKNSKQCHSLGPSARRSIRQGRQRAKVSQEKNPEVGSHKNLETMLKISHPLGNANSLSDL